ncbi:hypothetical protein [Algoriphagus sp. AK58]|uniref:hypothetical protein n=1 Tax=Algoriphagus sp. AK58 TaxID=1406877 RepID=UPI001650B215|nr:hypothetical protein [Algoriphagus sp. AK58]MBC6366430.1 hypothetical protein [Algoriphagus sp. AK58]
MKSRIEELIEKYWEAETSLEEERELKALLKDAEGYEAEKALFGILEDFQKEMPQKVSIPRQLRGRTIRIQWLGWAASIALLVSSVWIWQDYERRRQEEIAYQQVMEALALIQNNLSKGQEQLQPLNDLRYLNTTNQLFQTVPQK